MSDTADGITMSDYAEFASSLGYEWSNEGQIYFAYTVNGGISHLHQKDIEHLYRKLKEEL